MTDSADTLADLDVHWSEIRTVGTLMLLKLTRTGSTSKPRLVLRNCVAFSSDDSTDPCPRTRKMISCA